MSIKIKATLATEHEDLPVRPCRYAQIEFRPTKVTTEWWVKGSSLSFRYVEITGPKVKGDGTDSKVLYRNYSWKLARDVFGPEIEQVIQQHEQDLLAALAVQITAAS